MIQNIFKIFLSLTKLERQIVLGSGLVFVTSSLIFGFLFFTRITFVLPAYGGTYKEGLIEQPVFINPVLATSDVDKDIINLIYSNLFDISESVKVADNKLVWNIRLKEGVLWHDNIPFTADDVIFTIQSIHDRESRSPISITWDGISVERLSELEIKLTTSAPYAFFEDNLKQLYILPKHIFEDVPLANWRSSSFNLQPIGTGPYKWVSHEQEKSGFISDYQLTRNENYFGSKPYIENIELLFFKNEESAISSFNMARIDGLAGVSPSNLARLTRFNNTHELHMPSYYAIFLNQSTNELLKNKNVRQALNYATPKKEIIEKVFNMRATEPTGPLPYSGVKAPEIDLLSSYDIEKANQILDDGGINIDKNGTRGKITLVVPNMPFLVSSSEIIKENWSKLNLEIEVLIIEPALINDEIIKTRNYDAILFGNALARNPDIISFWHTKERFYPGQNLSLYSNKTVDSLLESVRQDFDSESRLSRLLKLQSQIIQDIPAIFLFSPNYIFITSTKVKGINELVITNPSDRLLKIGSWYLKTKRSFSNTKATSTTSTSINSLKLHKNDQNQENENGGVSTPKATTTPAKSE